MPELFVELLSEEIPARMQRKAADDFKRLVTSHLVDAGLVYEGAYASATPRRLILSVQGLPARSADRQEERKGPRVDAPEKAVAGFLRAAGLTSVDEAQVRNDPKKGDFYVARTVVPGREAIAVSAEAIADAVRRFPWPVSMRWGAASIDPSSLRWVRPLTAIVATFGAENEDPEIVPVAVEGVPVGDTTVGHRFHAPEPVRVRRLSDYGPALDRAKVVVDFERRRELISDGARNAAFALGLELVEDPRLLDEVTGLVEWPVVLVGRFEEASLSLPDEVIRLTIRENQKCFVTRDPATDSVSTAFVLTANLEATDGGAAIVAGNERVVRARLADARFFYDQDRKRMLAEHAEGLAAMTFHDALGSQAERVERIASVAGMLAAVTGADPADLELAAGVAKADLTTQMVGEFPELQGYVGRHYALGDGLPPAVAAAVEDHYGPLGPNDPVPTEPVTVALALADKAVALTGLWVAGEKPTGSGDPYALRRAALGIIRIILENQLRLPLGGSGAGLVPDALLAWGEKVGGAGSAGEIVDFVLDRFVVQQRDAGVRAEIVRAVLPALTQVDLVDVTRRIAALGDFLASEDGATLMAGYRRATNILRAEEKKDGRAVEGEVLPTRLEAAEEKALAGAVSEAGEAVSRALSQEDYEAAMRALAALRAPVDAFFDAVLVNADDPTVRENRLRLLAALRDVTRQVADFSQIPG